MVQVQIPPLKNFSAILAGVPVALENIVPGEFDLLFRQPVKQAEQDDARHPDFQRDAVDAVHVRLLHGEVPPLRKTEGVERAVVPIKHHLSVAFKQEGESATNGANVHRLPEAVQHQNMLV